MTYEYCVMHHSDPQQPHRKPFSEDDEGWQTRLVGDEALTWCEGWVRETEEMGFGTGAYYVARRPVGEWKRL